MIGIVVTEYVLRSPACTDTVDHRCMVAGVGIDVKTCRGTSINLARCTMQYSTVSAYVVSKH